MIVPSFRSAKPFVIVRGIAWFKLDTSEDPAYGVD